MPVVGRLFFDLPFLPRTVFFVHRLIQFLPRSMECRRGFAMKILSVRLSVRPFVCLSNAYIVTKRKKDLSRFLYRTIDHLASFSEKKNGWWGRPLLPEILGQPTPVERNRRF